MDSEISISPSETEDLYETPHELYSKNDITCLNNELHNADIPSIDNSENSSTEGKIFIDEKKYDEQSAKLEERLTELKKHMNSLKEELVEEKVAWQREVEEAMKVAKSIGVVYENDQINNKDQLYKEITTDVEATSVKSEPTVSELDILDYEQKLASYQEALTKAHIEKRTMLKRQLAANAYKNRLLEVEKLCNIELLKVKQNAQFLQPLQALVQNWEDSLNSTENTSKFDDELTGNVSKSPKETKSTKTHAGDASGKSEFLTMEDLESKIFKDLKEISTQIASTSCNTFLNDDELMQKRIMSMGWYNNELGTHCPFNPLM